MNKIYRDLTAKELDEIILFCVDADYCSYGDTDEDSERAERVHSAYKEIMKNAQNT